jgi:hypothetical protein
MMKKSIFTALLALILAGAMSSCSGNSPEGVVDRFFKCVSDKDYDGLVHLLYLDDELDGREPTDEEWEKFAAELKKYGSFGLAKLGDIKSFEILPSLAFSGLQELDYIFLNLSCMCRVMGVWV